MERILVLIKGINWVDAAPALHGARNGASAPGRLSFGLMLEEEMAEEDLREMYDLGTARWEVGDGSAWQAVERLWQGETYILMAHPAMLFARGWDKELLAMLEYGRRQGNTQVVITGCPPGESDAVDAVYPVAADAFDTRGRLCYHRGTPLRYARYPLRSAFVNPHFCFAPASFFRAAARVQEPLFLFAYHNRWHFYTASVPVVRMTEELPLPSDSLRGVTTENESSFCQRFQVDFTHRELSAMARCGIFEHDLSFETRVPVPVRVQEAVRSVKGHLATQSPLCVTAWLKLPDMPLDDARMIPFRRLCGIKNLPLLCFADHESASRITLSHPNVLEYKRRYGLQVSDEDMLADLPGYVKLCKPFILAKSREKFMTHSHYIWMDFDYLRYPVYERASFDWAKVCGDRIVMALVDGQPDTGMIVVPQDRLEPLCHEISSVCAIHRKRTGALPSEVDVWQHLMREHPDWFQTAAKKRPGQLFAMVLTPRGTEWATQA